VNPFHGIGGKGTKKKANVQKICAFIFCGTHEKPPFK
jgi:hypothetical protein